MRNIYYCFPDGKHKVLTLSYDDGNIADRRLVEILDSNGIKASFHLNGGSFDKKQNCVSASEVRSLYINHEVSAHTLTHPTIARCPLPQVAMQILEDRKILESIVGYPVRGMSYPNGSYSKEIVNILPGLGIEYARTVEQTNGFQIPDNFHEWKATCHHRKNLMELGQQFIDLNKKQYLYMMYVWGHSYEFDNDNNWQLIEDFCKMISGKDDTWYATNIQIVDYIKAAKELKFSANGDCVLNQSAMNIWISVDGRIIEIPNGGCIEI